MIIHPTDPIERGWLPSLIAFPAGMTPATLPWYLPSPI
nr:MAG TPA: hypothetical protein [Caudoviricetes sp.]DAZ75283.1 MAG TPA: hypothetical protein [Caudoviricetes sp.]